MAIFRESLKSVMIRISVGKRKKKVQNCTRKRHDDDRKDGDYDADDREPLKPYDGL